MEATATTSTTGFDRKPKARNEAIARLRDEEMAKMRKAKTTEKKVKEVQPSLFDF